ncbi:uncharacterized protein EV420DRAFT_1561489 [Desarmillaria tabescens]|uniref:Fe2OG dioxygenase domain-containing protein n=1 Tax=Armillaria tabescens TaxID=1929756 RepID=A0AA39K132_ARMTA|nr:uncharacterized protein EV420DRAFT_1561489 [Desarmillaria tabescens]KAK0451209.1 hypothetical protein EV420DRAFT_1561489 [Desarmillaria tabescens]
MSLTERRTFSHGQLEVSSDKLLLFYSKQQEGKEGVAHLLNLADASEESLRDLCDAADAAGFGLGNQNTFDETYRKSKKLDITQFSCNFDPRATKIFDQVQADLIEGQDEIQKVLRPELYKLNVYGEGDFFKAHKDTPRAENMMGSLVVIFPTVHKGGSLVLRQDGQEWTFSAEKMLADSTPEAPVISYVAFYSDTEHEVLPVTSGVRVTLTYNLYLEDKKPTAPTLVVEASSNPTPVDVLKPALQTLLADKNFLSEGGLLGFGLRHQYPFAVSKYRSGTSSFKIDGNSNDDFNDYIRDGEFIAQGRKKLSQLADSLKGSDASILRACRELGLDANIRILYRPRGWDVIYMTDHIIPDQEDGYYEDDELEEMLLKESGTLVSASDEYVKNQLKYSGKAVKLPEVVWVTPITTFNRTEASYMAYGNEASVGYLYGDVCLIVKVGLPGNRMD